MLLGDGVYGVLCLTNGDTGQRGHLTLPRLTKGPELRLCPGSPNALLGSCHAIHVAAWPHSTPGHLRKPARTGKGPLSRGIGQQSRHRK